MSMRRPSGSIVSTNNPVKPRKRNIVTLVNDSSVKPAVKAVKAFARKAGFRQTPLAGAKQAVSAYKAGRTSKKK